MIFLKVLFGGVIATAIAWSFVVAINLRSMRVPHQGLVAVAGGWSYLLQQPRVLLVLTVAFGMGMFVTSRVFRPHFPG